MTVAARIVGCLFAFLLLISVQPAYAGERAFRISESAIHATVDGAGNLQVEEQDTYDFDGAFNGIVVALDSSGSDGIEHFQAFKVTEAEPVPLRAERTEADNRLTYKIYESSQDESKVFRFTYTVKNVVQVYADTAELYWKFFDETNPSAIEQVNIDLELPAAVKTEEIEAFGHGPEAGKLEKDHNLVHYRLQPLPSGEMLEVRVLFPGSAVPDSARVSADFMLDAIREEEAGAAGDQGGDGIETVYGAAILLLLNVLAGAYIKFGRTFRSEWSGRYYSKLPDDPTPAVVGYLMNYRVKTDVLVATLADLVRKRYIDMKPLPSQGDKRKQPNYQFWRLKQDQEELQPHEANLLEWLFTEIGQNDHVTLANIRNYAKKQSGAFQKRWSEWQEEVKKTAFRAGYIEQVKWPRRGILLAAVVQIVGLLFFAPSDWKWLMICAIPLLLFIPRSQRRTREGQTAYAKWRAFKRFLRDHKRMEEQSLSAVDAGGAYFVYAIPLGEAKRAAALIRLQSSGTYEETAYLDSTSFYMHYEIWDSSFKQTFVDMYRSEASSDGSGDSFSSGGGGGGGGGGRDAF
ncbi:DUF2207 domain-containing protein [Paenibacillus athensensis]|uniref:DUF2207 domain-containing protein n=1 Tax=Paenibacillus athensensis TaxID=1967502 RepID=A0A4Y8Q8I3_9BACL|nr:DUF2207 domain-containing protein [Paenibacillus athensensis]MCD1260011.1 DUF2207 domain-containing protein [Paenibacillus athensensis]